MDIRLHPMEGYLRVEASGPYEIAAGREAIRHIRSECARLALGPASSWTPAGSDAAVSIADRFELARALADGCTAAVRFAILVHPDQMVTKTLEDSAVNRGVPVRTTASLAEAYGFLGARAAGLRRLRREHLVEHVRALGRREAEGLGVHLRAGAEFREAQHRAPAQRIVQLHRGRRPALHPDAHALESGVALPGRGLQPVEPVGRARLAQRERPPSRRPAPPGAPPASRPGPGPWSSPSPG